MKRGRLKILDEEMTNLLNNRNAVLITDSQDLEAVFENIGLPKRRWWEFSSAFVVVGEGEYEQVYAMARLVPMNGSIMEEPIRE